jgi:hypothetical protein
MTCKPKECGRLFLELSSATLVPSVQSILLWIERTFESVDDHFDAGETAWQVTQLDPGI